MSARQWAASLGKVGLAWAFDPTGMGAALTAGKELIGQFAGALGNRERDRVERFLAGVEAQLQAELDRGAVAPSDVERLLSNAEDLLRRYAFGSYDLALARNSATTAAAQVMKRGATRLHTLDRDDRSRLSCILVAYFEALIRDPRLFDDLGQAFRDGLGGDIAELEARIAESENALGEQAARLDGLRRWLQTVQAAGILTERRLVATKLTPSVLVKAEYGIVPFHGRERELEELQAWCRSDAPVALRVCHGRGGIGKTRLMMELIDRLRLEEAGAWRCGLLARDSAPRLPSALPVLLQSGESLLGCGDNLVFDGIYLSQSMIAAIRTNPRKLRSSLS